ncbi:MAG: bifunctional DNA primase/polymerase, partial [Betaproteobacteria bacterium]|nr:bifunctional DNA primase/polymerase [Betaproteobacteria bacterium]
MSNELAQLAINIARNTGWPVYPVSEAKAPAIPKAEGGNGFYDASTNEVDLQRMFSHRRAALIGIRTGEASGISVLDIDRKHPEALGWFKKYERHIPPTRTYRTRGGGLHIYFQHGPGVKNSEGRPVIGIDVRGEGGGIIHWFAHGFECLDNSPPAPWPIWLSALIWPPPPPISRAPTNHGQLSQEALERVRQAAIRKAGDAREGTKHHAIRDAALMLGGIQDRAGFSDADATAWLLEATGLRGERKAENTIAWG